jgi:hypothetical protein
VDSDNAETQESHSKESLVERSGTFEPKRVDKEAGRKKQATSIL